MQRGNNIPYLSMSSTSTDVVCSDLKKAISEHDLACSNLYGSLGQGPVDTVLEAKCQSALAEVNTMASRLVDLLNPSNRDMIRETLDLLKNHYDEWEVKNDNGKNPVDDLTRFNTTVILCLFI